MKFRMHENSLFAILLRGPWWISFAIAAVFALAAMALLPRHLAPYAVAGVLPFVVIGVIATVRQSRKPSAGRVAQTLDRVRAMSWREFGATIEQAYRQRGYEVQALQRGADFQLQRGTERALVSCKRWKAAGHGVEPLKELQAAAVTQEATSCIYIALNPLSDAARRYAREQRIVLLQDVELVELVTPALSR